MAEDPPPLTDDQTSGRMFVRWNAVTLVVGLVALLLGALAVRARGGDEAPGPLGLTLDPAWDDGRAEVARYAARRTVYGREQAYTLVRLAVKEPFDPARGVKPDAAGPGHLDAIKTGAVHAVPTGRAYEHRQTLFLRLDRADPRRALDLSMGSQEWCGNTFVRLVRREGGLARRAHSYWDGEGDWSDVVPAGVWLEDQLPFTVRALAPGAAHEVDLLPTTLGLRAAPTRPVRARLAVEGVERLTTPAGTFQCVLWVVRAGDRAGRYWVATDAPLRPLVRFEDATGRGELTSLERTAYWAEE
ncbi:MAG: hypothetical protein M9894_31050 [Planctomycetes bacterium]|nr:hypothetical protein [Planctomycetota bacterium]